MKIFAYIPINLGRWQHAKPGGHGGTQEKKWHNMYFMEAAIDLSDLPDNTHGKLLVEFKDDRWEIEHVLGRVGVRLAYQPRPGKWLPFRGSEVYTEGGHRWIMGKSRWFEFKPTPRPEYYEPFDGVGLLWIQGMQQVDSDCVVAFVNIALGVPEDD